MVFKWILKRMYDSSIDPVSTGFVDASYTTTEGNIGNATNFFSRDLNKYTNLQSGLNEGIIVKFNNSITITKYMLRLKQKQRFLKGWKVEGSYDGNTYMTIDEKNENFCLKTYEHNKYLDCGELTIRAFNIPPTTVKNLRITMTQKDSCGTYWFHFGGFDVLGALPNHDLYCISHIITRITSKASILLFIVMNNYS